MHPDQGKDATVEAPTPYRDAARTYRAAGWVGVLPLPYGTKKLRKTGWTGHNGAWPSSADIQAWIDNPAPDEGGGNLALRLPPNLIGIDLDAYPGKNGAATYAAAAEQWGELPPTYSSTARSDGVSRIRVYQVPEGLRWPGQVGEHVEIIQYAHRYMAAWPSINPETGTTYRWYRPDGLVSTVPPRPEDFAELPDSWIVGLTGCEMAEEVHFADLTRGESSAWMMTNGGGHPCGAMTTIRDRLLAELTSGSAHESLRRLMGLVRLAECGHTGLVEAIGTVSGAFIVETTRPGRPSGTRTPEEARGEFGRSLDGATRRVLGSPAIAPSDPRPADPCTQPFAGLIPSTPVHNPVDVQKPAPTPVVPARDEQAADTPTPVPVEHTSWWPRDLEAVLDGQNVEPPPAVLLRSDKQALLYAGKVNGLLGESESGKTWVALLAVAQAVDAGDDVLYLDFEDAAAGITARLLSLGVSREALLAHFVYIDPDEALNVLAAADFTEVLDSRQWSIVVVDGVNAAMSLMDMDLESNKDATRFAQLLLKPIARRGPAVLTIDHVPKNKETRGKGGIGAQAKRAMVTGCALLVEVTVPFGRGQTGRLRLTVDKDRGGHVRGLAAFGKNVGTAVMTSNSDGSSVSMDIKPAEEKNDERTPFRPTSIMQNVSRLLKSTNGELSGAQIEAQVGGKREYIRAALDCLVNEGFVARRGGPRNAILHSHQTLYTELLEIVHGDPRADDDDD